MENDIEKQSFLFDHLFDAILVSTKRLIDKFPYNIVGQWVEHYLQ